MILPCGAGKTFVALWIKETLNTGSTLVLVPSLALLRQIKDEWAANKNKSYKYLCVCSEVDIDDTYDAPRVHSYELGSNVTTQPDKIAEFLQDKCDKVIFSTYQSLPAIEIAMSKATTPFDLVICDEAHKTAGSRNGNSFTLIHDNGKIPAKSVYI